MKISSITSYLHSRHLGLVRVTTDDGAEGWGQVSPYIADQSISVLHDQLSSWFLGKDPWDLPAIVDECVRAEYKFYGTTLFRALCGIDTAVWDLLARSVGLPVYKLLGGAVRTKIAVYGSSMRRDITPPDEAERLQALVDSGTFTGFKIRIGEVMGRDGDAAAGRTESIIPMIRTALGEDVTLRADANGGYSTAEAIRVGRILEEYGYYHYEEPCPYPQLENTAAVAAALDIPIAGGEQDNSLEQFHRMIEGRVVDIVQPDIGYLGGITRARKVAGMAEAAGIWCTPHCANTSLLQIFTLHLAASSPSVTQAQEWSIEDVDWVRDLYDPLPPVHGGFVELGAEPGWGVNLNPDYLKASQTRTSAV